MAKKKGRPPVPVEEAKTKTGKACNFWIKRNLADAIEAWRKSQRPEVGETAFFIMAAEDFLEARGKWPPQDDADD